MLYFASVEQIFSPISLENPDSPKFSPFKLTWACWMTLTAKFASSYFTWVVASYIDYITRQSMSLAFWASSVSSSGSTSVTDDFHPSKQILVSPRSGHLSLRKSSSSFAASFDPLSPSIYSSVIRISPVWACIAVHEKGLGSFCSRPLILTTPLSSFWHWTMRVFLLW